MRAVHSSGARSASSPGVTKRAAVLAHSRTMPEKSKKPQRVSPRFTSVAVVVADRQKAVAWYTEKLGLDLVDDHEHWQAVGRKGSPTLHLCQVTEFEPNGALEPGNTGIALALPGEFRAACAALEAQGVPFVSPPTKYDWGWGATIRDPDGNEFYLHPER